MKKTSFTQMQFKFALVLAFGIFALSMNAQDECVVNAMPETLPPPWTSTTLADVQIEVQGIPADETLTDISVDISLNHTWTSDLDIFLIAPDGQQRTMLFSVCPFDDWAGANVNFSDAGSPFMCGNPIPAQNASPVEAFSGFTFANTSELNGQWTVRVSDPVGGDGGEVLAVTLNLTTTGACAAPPADTCFATCPGDEIFFMDPGQCAVQYGWEITVEGNADGCFLGMPDPIQGFTGPFAPEAAVGGGPPAGGLNYDPFPDGCVQGDADAITLQTYNNTAPFCGPFIGTLIRWQVPEDGTVSFDWEYNAQDGTPDAQFGYTNVTSYAFADIIDLNDAFGSPNQSGTITDFPVSAGGTFNFIIWDLFGTLGPATGTLSNFSFQSSATGAMLNIIQGAESGEFLTEGEYPYEVEIIYLDGSSDTCSWNVTVNAFTDPTTTLACNDNVQVSVDQECSAFVGADMILEGGPYACYDGYLVEIENYGGNLGGMMIDGDAIGQTLTVTVTDTLTGNSCWGTITVEDKLPPLITQCDTITLPCGIPTDPVFTAPGVEFISESLSPNAPIDMPAGENVDFQIEVPVSGQPGYAVTDVNVTLQITHTWSADLEVSITAPNGVTVPLATAICGATDDWDVTFDDDGAPLVCSGGPALQGTLMPEQPLSQLNGAVANGIWTINVVDNFPVLDAGSVDFIQLDIETEELQASAPVAIDNCSDVTLEYEDLEGGDECDAATIDRLWTATDASGNTSTCLQVILIEPLDLSALECPENYEGDCDDSIDPSNTGYPLVGGVEIDGGSFCNIFLDYWDKELPACGNGSKIIRTWTILDWCTQETVECVQIIKLESTGPGLICPDDQTVGADPWTCETDVNLVPPTVSEVCGGTAFNLVPTASNGTIVDFGNGNFRVDGLPLGETVITWTAEDECGAEASCSYVITVIDDVPPVALCDEHTIVSLTFDSDLDQGLTKVPAYVFDDGSYDNCTDVTFTAARMSSCIDFDWTTGGACVDEIKNGRVTSTDRGTAFRECVPFACCDVAAGPIMVVLRVTDEFNNVNECMVEVEVQDKIKPFITCPPDIIVSCDFWFAADETGGFVPTNEDVLTPIFGDVLDAFEFDQEDRQDIVIDDPGNDELPQPYNWGKDGFADDNCDVDITVNVTIQDDCSGDDFNVTPPHPNAVRLITRTFRARDGQGNLSDCRQRIWVVDYDPFYISDETCVDVDRNDGVKWPCDEEYDFCPQGGIDPTYPEIFDDNCSLIGVTFEDTRFDFVDGACYKILREWTVIDWCQYDGQGAGIWSYVQVIKVLDNEPTFILGCPINPETKSVLDRGVTLPDNNQVFLGEDNPLATSCTVHVTDTFRLSEFCSDEVTYDVKIFPFNGPDFLQIHEKRTVELDTNGFADAVIDTRSSDILGVRLNGLPYNSNVCSNWPLAGGEKDYHRVLITVEDGCGNVNSCEYLLRLEDKKAPSPVCVGLSSVVMPSSGEVTIWAKDFNASSFDDCTPAADLLYSFSGDTYEPSRSFTCADIEANGSPSFIVEIYVADKGNDDNCNGFRTPNQNMGITDGIEWAERNKDFCTTFIVIDDNEGVCGNGGSAGGVISTEELEPVEKVSVNLKDGNGNVVTSFTTDKDGIYHFINPLLDLDIEPVRNDDHKNGVSTLDLVKIQKHLLGIEDLGSPYKLIAADANNSSSVSAIDLVELRKLILGLYSELPNNSSWRFADGNYVFADEANPWDFVEVVNIQGLAMDKDFVAIKIGDVNGTVSANSNSIETRNVTGAMKFQAVDQTVEAGQEVLVDVTSADFNNIIGYQFTLQTAGLKLTDVVAGAIDMGIENVGVHKNSVTASWHRTTAVSAEADDVLFTLAFTATNSGQLSEMLNINSRLTEAEAYDESENILDVAITFTTEELAQAGKDFALFQNSPNPFNGETVIAFTLPEAMEATLTVFDVTGKVVYLTEGDYAAGYNNVTVTANDLSATGVLYYRLDADDFTATKKMVLID